MEGTELLGATRTSQLLGGTDAEKGQSLQALYLLSLLLVAEGQAEGHPIERVV